MLSDTDKRRLREYIERYKRDWRSDVRENAKDMIDIISARDPETAKKIKLMMGYKDSKMDYKKFIDSVVGNIARKIEDEFNENDHPRDKGGKFTSKGGEGKGGKEENSNVKSVKHGKYNIKVQKHGDDKYSYYSYENGKDGSITYASGNASSEEEALKKAKNKLDEHDKRYGTIPETETEKAAKEELGEHDQDYYTEELLRTASDIDTAMEALNKLDWDTKGIDDLEGAQEAIKEAVKRNPEKAKELVENTPDTVSEEDEQESPKELIQKDLRRNVSTHVEDLVDYAKEDGYEAELESEEYMIVRKDGKEYRAHIDRAGDSYYVDKVEEL